MFSLDQGVSEIVFLLLFFYLGVYTWNSWKTPEILNFSSIAFEN